MATQSVNLTAEFNAYASELVKDGRYASVEEVFRAAIDALKREECDDAAKAAALEQALEEGFASGVYEGDAFADVRREMGWDKRS